ncbi:MAG: NERD domain-containing protein [Pseudomonadota bacterium]|nr:NERD domain-containing protein [Pseudomonadota bacterium]
MATIFPDNTRANVVFCSRAEQDFYKRCRKLNDDWHVFYSCHLAGIEGERGMLDNEMDFLLYHHQLGLIVIEVKGGRILCQEGKFYSINRYDEQHEIKNPFQQALLWKSRFVAQLRQQNIKVPVCYAVCLPSTQEQDFEGVAGIETGIIIGRGRYQRLEQALVAIMQQSTPTKFRCFKDVAAKLTRFIKGKNFISRLYLRDYIDSHDLRLQDIDVIQETLVTPISSSKRIGIEGEAGTGKSMLALYLARHFHNLGKRVLLLSSNPLQSYALQNKVTDKIKISTFLALANAYGVDLLTPPPEFREQEDDWRQYHAPEKLEELIKASPPNRRYDVLICDEAQDVQPFWWGAFKELLASDAARFYLFFDRSQGVFGSGGRQMKFEPEDVLPIASPYFPLVHNYRTTREISEFARSFRTGSMILKSHCGRLGYTPKLLTYKDKGEFLAQLEHLLNKLVRVEKVRPDEIAILSARDPHSDDSLLQGLQKVGALPLHRFRLRQHRHGLGICKQPTGSVLVSTVQGFKGLETKVAILVNFSEYQLPITHPIMASLFYVACTRAKHMLYLFGKEGDEKVEAFANAIAASRGTGSLLIDTSLHDFVGTIIYYDAQRIGWLQVLGQNHYKSMVMFFPHDVRHAGIAVEVGKKIRFTPRNAGYVIVASDLKEIKVAA